jgi:hypothetical protein
VLYCAGTSHHWNTNLVGFEAAVVERVDRPKFESISKKKKTGVDRISVCTGVISVLSTQSHTPEVHCIL